MSQFRTLAVGLDVHQESITVASVAPEHGAEVISLGTIGTRLADIAQLTRTRPSKATHLGFVYAAGPCGSWLSRDLRHKGDDCGGVAPSLMPKQAGERVNTDRRDARHLARLRRSGDLTPVDGPTVDDDAIRDLGRAREEAIRDLKATNLRLNALLRRHALRSPGRATWSPAPLRGRSDVVGPPPAPQLVFQEDVRAVNEHAARRQRLAQARHAPVPSWRWHPVVEALQARRGVPCTGAVTTVAELGALTRIDHPRHLLAYVGLPPAASSRGPRRRQGAMTTAGNTPARRAVVEGAWASRSPANVSRP